jgi:hypothetical protein
VCSLSKFTSEDCIAYLPQENDEHQQDIKVVLFSSFLSSQINWSRGSQNVNTVHDHAFQGGGRPFDAKSAINYQLCIYSSGVPPDGAQFMKSDPACAGERGRRSSDRVNGYRLHRLPIRGHPGKQRGEPELSCRGFPCCFLDGDPLPLVRGGCFGIPRQSST